MLCQFLLYSKVNQLYICRNLVIFGFPSLIGHHRALSSFLCCVQVLTSYPFHTQQCVQANPSLPVHPIPLPLFLPISLCISISVLQVSSSVQPNGYFLQYKIFKRKLKPTKPIILNSRAILIEEIELNIKDYKMEVVIYII